ncbi:MAG TPA: thioesterase family protein [Spirochaetota bacterium]|nr:thioesterase family protein [Spirochaetota bacterium]HPI90940.1 thioesterase family protein [Spirochaetota bacterium]HPR47067.1 thioesterase family protein [Spirochaetota bacterium]
MAHTCEITVRGNELDSFGHVNNAVYLNYCEQARWEILREKNLLHYFTGEKLVLVVTECNIRYSGEAKVFDVLAVETELKRESPYLVFRHKIYNRQTGALINKATVKTLLVSHDRVPQDIPDDFI